MGKLVNLPLGQILVRFDFGRRVALEFKRDGGQSVYLAFEPTGLQVLKRPTPRFLQEFQTAACDLLAAVRSMLRSLHKSYLPDRRASDILTEIIIMSQNEGNADLGSLSLKAVTATYNVLAEQAGRNQVKEFKSKAEGIKRVEALRAELATPTAEQQVAADKKQAEAAKRLEALNTDEAKADKARAKEVKASTKAAVKHGALKTFKASFKANITDPIKAVIRHEAKPPKPEAEPTKPKPNGAARPPRAKETKPDSPKPRGIGAFCAKMLSAGKSNEEALAAVRTEFPDAKTSLASVAWYRNKLRSETAGA